MVEDRAAGNVLLPRTFFGDCLSIVLKMLKVHESMILNFSRKLCNIPKLCLLYAPTIYNIYKNYYYFKLLKRNFAFIYHTQ